MTDWIPYAGFVVALIGVVLGGVRHTQSMQTELRHEMMREVTSVEADLKVARVECIEATRLAKQLTQELRLHCAETYATKAGLSEQTAQIMKALDGIGTRIEGIGNRIDRFYDTPKPRTSPRS